MYELILPKHKTIYPSLFKISAHKTKVGGELLKEGKKVADSLRGLFTDSSIEDGTWNKVWDFSNELSKAVISKDVFSVDLKPFEHFILPYPSNLQESYSGSYENSEFNLSKIKLDAIEKATPAVTGMLPFVGGALSSFSGTVVSTVRENLDSYIKRSGMFLDPNIKQVFSSMQPRTISMGFKFVFENKKHKDNVMKGLAKLKELSLATQDKVFHNDIFPMRYLKMDTVFSFEFIQTGKKTNKTLNNILHCKISPNIVQSEGFFLQSIKIQAESLMTTGGYLEDGSPKSLDVSMDFVEVRPLFRDAWDKPTKNKYEVQKFYPNSEIQDFITIKAYDLTSKVLPKIKSAIKPTASKSVEAHTKDVDDMANDAKNLAKAGVASKVGGLKGMAIGAGIASLTNSDGFKKAIEIGGAVKSIATEISKDLKQGVLDLYNESDTQQENNKRVIGNKPDCTIILPIPYKLPDDDLTHNYESSKVDNAKRLEQNNTLGKYTGKLANATQSALADTLSRAPLISKALGQTFASGVMELIKMSKDIAIKKIQRDGYTINPFEVRTYTGTEIRSYSISYNIVFKSEAHFEKIMDIIGALKYYMTSQDMTGGDGESVFNTFLRRPHYFTLDFNNDVINKQYDIKDLPLNLNSITTIYDDPLATEDGLPKIIKITMKFSEIAPRRKS